MAIEIKNLTKAYGDKQVLDNFSMTIEKGINCIMGASGSGKTTLVNILAGLVKADDGSISAPENAQFSFVFQEDRLLEWETALSNVLFVCKEPKIAQEQAKDLLTEAGLGDSIDKKAKELSGGMKRRVAICRGLIADYDIIILDEPFKGLDAGIKPTIMDMVKSHTEGKYAIIITHDASEAEYLGGKFNVITPIQLSGTGD